MQILHCCWSMMPFVPQWCVLLELHHTGLFLVEKPTSPSTQATPKNTLGLWKQEPWKIFNYKIFFTSKRLSWSKNSKVEATGWAILEQLFHSCLCLVSKQKLKLVSLPLCGWTAKGRDTFKKKLQLPQRNVELQCQLFTPYSWLKRNTIESTLPVKQSCRVGPHSICTQVSCWWCLEIG